MVAPLGRVPDQLAPSDHGGFRLDGIQLAAYPATRCVCREKANLPEALASVGQQSRRRNLHVLGVKLLHFAAQVGDGDDIGLERDV